MATCSEKIRLVFGIHINSIKGKDQQTKPSGPDPFNNLAIEFNANGIGARPVEWTNGGWSYSADSDSYSLKSQPIHSKDRVRD